MNCDEIRTLIHEAHDDARTVALPEGVAAHLASCGACRSLEEDLATLSEALRSLPSDPLPGDALDEVWRKTVRARSAPARNAGGYRRFAAAVFFVSVLSAATLYLVLAPPSPPGPSAPSAIELARASAQADLVFGYTARALAATRSAATDRVLASRISPAVRGVIAPHPTRRPS